MSLLLSTAIHNMGHSWSSPSSTMASQPPRHFMAAPDPQTISRFFSIPPELRIIIYEFAFSTAPQGPSEISLAHAAPPSKAILQTCQQGYCEVFLLHKQAYREYWRTTIFTLDAKDAKTPALLASVKDDDFSNIKLVDIRGSHNGRTVLVNLTRNTE